MVKSPDKGHGGEVHQSSLLGSLEYRKLIGLLLGVSGELEFGRVGERPLKFWVD